MEKVAIQISRATKEKLDPLAAKTSLTTDKVIEVMIEAFVAGKGKFFTGDWKEGPGIRIMTDWPRFSAGVMRIKQEEMEGAKK
jgi:hypothetical protein